MILYVDESECEKYFIVTGVLFKSKKDANNAYRSFKNKINNFPISIKAKTSIYTEFKSYLIDVRFQRIKKEMLKSIIDKNGVIIYSVYIKKEKYFKQSNKEKVYINLLKDIVKKIKEQIDIVYDGFKLLRFERIINEEIGSLANVSDICSGDSQLIPGLQFADNVCSVIKKKLQGNDINNYYSIIEKCIYK